RAARERVTDEVRADEAGRAGHDEAHRLAAPRAPAGRPLRSRGGRGHVRRRAVDAIRAGLGDEVAGTVQRLHGAGVRPPSLEHLAGEVPSTQVPVVHVGDLELASRRRLERADHVEHPTIVHVDAGDGIAALRAPRLLLDRDDTAVAHLGHTEALSVLDLLQHDARPARLATKTTDCRRNGALDQVVAEHHTYLAAIGEVLAERERRGDAAFALLVRVVQVREAELPAVPEQTEEVAGVRPP